MSATPAGPAGAIAVMEVAELTEKLAAAAPAKSTAPAPVNPVPMMVTRVPPPVSPLLGATRVTETAPVAPAADDARKAPIPAVVRATMATTVAVTKVEALRPRSQRFRRRAVRPLTVSATTCRLIDPSLWCAPVRTEPVGLASAGQANGMLAVLPGRRPWRKGRHMAPSVDRFAMSSQV
jgi:hypothetical protein